MQQLENIQQVKLARVGQEAAVPDSEEEKLNAELGRGLQKKKPAKFDYKLDAV